MCRRSSSSRWGRTRAVVGRFERRGCGLIGVVEEKEMVSRVEEVATTVGKDKKSAGGRKGAERLDQQRDADLPTEKKREIKK